MERFEPNGPNPSLWVRAMRDDTHKLIQTSNRGEEFYDLSVDPLETNPLSLSSLTSLQQASYNDLKQRLTVLSP